MIDNGRDIVNMSKRKYTPMCSCVALCSAVHVYSDKELLDNRKLIEDEEEEVEKHAFPKRIFLLPGLS